MKTIDMHERLKRSMEANIVLCDQVDEQEKQIGELIEMLERGCTGTHRLLVQRGEEPSVIKWSRWRKESQELINKVRSK